MALPPSHPDHPANARRRHGRARVVRATPTEPEPSPAMVPPIVLEVAGWVLIAAGLLQLAIYWPTWLGAVLIGAGLVIDWRARLARNEIRAAHLTWLAAGPEVPDPNARLALTGHGEVQCSPACAGVCPPGQCRLMTDGATPAGPNPMGGIVWEAPGHPSAATDPRD